MAGNDSYLVPRMVDGVHVTDDAGRPAWDEAYGLHPDTPEPAPTPGVRRFRRPGEEDDLPDERIIAKERAEVREQKATLDTREKMLAEKEAAIEERRKVVEKMIADSRAVPKGPGK